MKQRTNTTNNLVSMAVSLLEKIFRNGIYCKRVGIMVSDISPTEYIQPDLFEFNLERRKKLSEISTDNVCYSCHGHMYL